MNTSEVTRNWGEGEELAAKRQHREYLGIMEPFSILSCSHFCQNSKNFTPKSIIVYENENGNTKNSEEKDKKHHKLFGLVKTYK